MPGTLAPRPELPPPTIELFEYDAQTCERHSLEPGGLTEALAAASASGRNVWINVEGVGDADAIRAIGSVLGLHPLTLEDIVHVHQRPKAEEFERYLFVVMRAFHLTPSGGVEHEQISFVLEDGLLVTFQERPGDGFEPVRKRLREGIGPMRSRGVDYLLYALLDAAIDNLFPVIDLFVDSMDQIEEELRAGAKPELAAGVHTMRRDLRLLRRSAGPLRDLSARLNKGDLRRVDEALRPAFRDCFDQVAQAVDLVDGCRERAGDLANLYQTMVSEKTNEVMKVLTIIATVFIPLTFLCGLYGMNFDPEASPFNMPELRMRFGYPVFWGVMLLTTSGMIWFFRRRGWIGHAARGPDGG